MKLIFLWKLQASKCGTQVVFHELQLSPLVSSVVPLRRDPVMTERWALIAFTVKTKTLYKGHQCSLTRPAKRDCVSICVCVKG